MGKKRREFAFRQRLISQSEFHRNIVKPARCEAAIEMPQSRNDHSDDGDLDVGPRLIEDEEIETCAPGDIDAGQHLVARVVEAPKSRAATEAFDALLASETDSSQAAMA